jgi:hypothetical protein
MSVTFMANLPVKHRGFPSPWSFEEHAACFVVHDEGGQALTCVHFENEPGRRSVAKLLTRERHGGCAEHRQAANDAACADRRLMSALGG